MEDTKLLVKTDVEAAVDLTTLLKEIFNRNESLQQSPLYIVAESYGGKFAVTLGLAALEAIEAGNLKLKLGGNYGSNNPLQWQNFKNLRYTKKRKTDRYLLFKVHVILLLIDLNFL